MSGYTKGELIEILDEVHDEAVHLCKSSEDRDVEIGERIMNILGRYVSDDAPTLVHVDDDRQLVLGGQVHGPAYDANGTYIDH